MTLPRVLLPLLLCGALAAQVVLNTDPFAQSGATTAKNVVRAPNGNLYCLSVAEDSSGNRPLLLQVSTDGGQSFSTDPFVFNDASSGLTGPASANPTTGCALAIDSLGILHALWGRYYYPSFFRQYYRSYDPASLTASAIVDLTATFGIAVTSRTNSLDIAVDAADTVWITAQSPSSWVSRLLRSNLPSASDLAFTSVGNISPSASSQSPVLCVDAQGLIHCGYYRNIGPGEYHHSIYDPVAATWGPAVSIGNGSTAPHDYAGRLAADALGNVHAIVAVDVGTPNANWSFEYRRWDSVSGWSAPTVVFTATPAEYTNIANYWIFALGCEEATGRCYALYRDLSAGGVLRLAQKGLSDAAFATVSDLLPPTSGAHEYYVPTIRGALYPSFNNTATEVDMTWQWRTTPGTPPYSLVFQRYAFGTPGVTITLGGPAVVGASTTINLSSPADANAVYACGLSLGNAPGIVLADLRVIPLNLDPVLLFTLDPNNGVLFNPTGFLDGGGQATLIFAVPNAPLAGLTLYSAFVVADPGDPTGIGTISPSLAITIN